MKQRFDTIKTAIPLEIVKIRDERDFRRTTQDDEGVVLSEILNYKLEKPLGLSVFQVKKTAGAVELIIEGSAKLLGLEYAEGVNIDNIGRWFEPVLQMGAVEFGKDEAVRRAKLYRVDVTDNIPVTHPVSEYISAFRQHALPERWVREPYATGIAFRKLNANHTRFIAYSPFDRMMKHPEEISLLNGERLRGMLRNESNHRTLDSMRRAFRLGAGDIMLSDVLRSQERVNLKAFDRLFSVEPNRYWKHETVMELMKRVKSMHELNNEVVYRFYVEAFGGDVRSFHEQVLKRLLSPGSNPSSYKRKFRQMATGRERRRGTPGASRQAELMNEVREYLKAS